MMSCVCNVAGASPVGGVIVGASPALAVTAGNPAADPDTVSSPPSVVIDANTIASTAKAANTFTKVFFGIFLLVIRFRLLT
jgi:hypothetical protein